MWDAQLYDCRLGIICIGCIKYVRVCALDILLIPKIRHVSTFLVSLANSRNVTYLHVGPK